MYSKTCTTSGQWSNCGDKRCNHSAYRSCIASNKANRIQGGILKCHRSPYAGRACHLSSFRQNQNYSSDMRALILTTRVI